MAVETVVLKCLSTSPLGMRVRIALAEKGIKYEYKDVGSEDPDFSHNEKDMDGSLIILQYIDEVWNEKSSLLPTDPYQRAFARRITGYIDEKVYNNGKNVVFLKGKEQEAAKDGLIEALQQLIEQGLEEKPYFGGDCMGFVDVALIPFYSWFHTYEVCGNINIKVECPKLIEWAKRCLEKESVAQTLPDPHKIYDTVLEHQKDLEMFEAMAGETAVLECKSTSPFGMRIRIALAEKGIIKYEYKDEGDVANFSHNGRLVAGTSLIKLEYIDEVWNKKSSLLPTDPYQRSFAKTIVLYIDNQVFSNGTDVIFLKGEEQEAAKIALIEALKNLEEVLEEKPYFGGEDMSIVDVALVPFYSWFHTYEVFGNINIEIECPKLIEWAKRCLEKESVAQTLPDPHKIYNSVLEQKLRLMSEAMDRLHSESK